MANSQIPLHFEIVGRDGKVNQPWAFWFNNITASLPPPGAGNVIDGSNTSYGQMTLFQGPDINKGSSPSLGWIYFATDTGKIYVEQAGAWVLELPAFSGDATSPVNSAVLTLNTVNAAVGTWGSSTTYPVITVNEKGLVTNVTLETISGSAVSPGGPGFSVQYNDGGVFNGDGTFLYNPTTQTLTARNIIVNGTVTYFNRVPNQNNLLPVQTGLAGSALTTDGTNVSWQKPWPDQTPYFIGDTETFTVRTDKQVLYAEDIQIDGELIVNGLLIGVRPDLDPTTEGNTSLAIGTILRTPNPPLTTTETWVPCDGSIYSQPLYPTLFSAVGTTFQQYSGTQTNCPGTVYASVGNGNWVGQDVDNSLLPGQIRIVQSPNLSNWGGFLITTTNSNAQVVSIAANGTGVVVLLFAAGNSGDTFQIWFSTDYGVTWAQSNYSSPYSNSGTAWVGFNGTHFVVTQADTTPYVSTNGSTWTAAVAGIPPSGLLNGVWMNNQWIFNSDTGTREIITNNSSNLSGNWIVATATGAEASYTNIVRNGYWNVLTTAIIDPDNASYSADGIDWSEISTDQNYPPIVRGGQNVLVVFVGNTWLFLNAYNGNKYYSQTSNTSANMQITNVKSIANANTNFSVASWANGFIGDTVNKIFCVDTIAGDLPNTSFALQPNHNTATQFNIPNIQGSFIRIA